MSINGWWLKPGGIVGAGLIVLLLVLNGCAKRTEPMTTQAIPSVTVIHPRRGDMVETVELPGDLVGFYETALHAKVTGYLQSITVDKGDTVKADRCWPPSKFLNFNRICIRPRPRWKCKR